MTNITQNTSADASIFLSDEAPVHTVAPSPEIEAYQARGWKLCSIDGKDAHIKGWNKPGHELQGMPISGTGVGLCHAYSGTAALDIDDMARARNYLLLHGVDLDALLNAPDAVQIVSREGRGKLLYSLPVPRQTKTVRDGKTMVLELRCGTKSGNTMQDVLPPSIHPGTNQPYTWGGKGDWRALPPMPQGLLSLWNELSSPDAPVRTVDSSVQMPLATIQSALAAIDPDAEGYEGWLKIGMALFEEGDHLLDEFISWSSRSGSFDPAECEDKWESFGRGAPGNITIDTLGYMARKAAWQEPLDWSAVAKVRKEEAAKVAEKATDDLNAIGLFKPDEQYMLDNIYTLKEGSQRFYDKSDRSILGAANCLDQAYGKLALGPTGVTKPSKWLAGQNDCKVCKGLAWMPGEGDEDDVVIIDGGKYLNTYRGPTVEPERNDALLVRWLMLSRHIFGEHTDLVLDHMAFSCQYPGKKICWQVLTHGGPRSGKTMTVRPITKLYENSCGSMDAAGDSHAWGDVYHENKFIIYEEVDNADPKHFNELKPKLANEDVEQLNIKTKGMRTQKNVYSMYLFSNSETALKFDEDQDKLLVIHSPSSNLGEEFYDALADGDMEHPDFLPAFHWFLKNRDVSQFKHGKLPVRTAAMKAMVAATVDDSTAALREGLESNMGLFSNPVLVHKDLKIWLKQGGYYAKDSQIKKAVKDAGWKYYKGRSEAGGAQKQVSFIARVEDGKGKKAAELFEYHNENATL